MEAPSERTEDTSTQLSANISGEAGGKAGIPLFAQGEAKVGGEAGYSRTSQTGRIFHRGGIAQVVREIAGSDFVVFVDDFHYMSRELQAEIARQIKEAAESGVRICTASVPHRADDVVRGNPELRGRVRAIDFSYWDNDDLMKIANKGFAELNLVVSDKYIKGFAQEASGSPQLMQAICLQMCFAVNCMEAEIDQKAIDWNPDLYKTILERTTAVADFTSLVEGLHAGPKTRGTERKEFPFCDGSVGDVYRCLLLAIKNDPPRLSFNYDEIIQRAQLVCSSDKPGGSSLNSSLEYMSKIEQDLQPNNRTLEWDENVLNITDPYFLFFLRWSPKIDILGRSN
jgi:hypothetical protein